MYMIYGKAKDMKKFQPVNLTDGTFEVNKIHGSMFMTQEEADRAVKHLNEMNPDIQFEHRKQG